MSWQAKYLTGMCVLMLGLVWFGFRRARERDNPVPRPQVSDPVVSDAPLPQVSKTPFLNTGDNAAYIGSEKCIECHADQAETYFHTSHSRSMSVAGSSELESTAIRHAKSGFAYQSQTRDGRLTQSESILVNETVLADSRRDATVDYVVGSGNFGHSFLFQLDDFYVQSPLTWYTTRDCWDMSPGYDTPNQRSFRRAISAGCLYCHAGAVEIENGNAYDVSVVETAIGCERCHGPGSLHADRHENSSAKFPGTEIDYTIVNPAHLSRELSEAVCQQCHLQGDSQILVRGHDYDSFRPGLPLEDFRQDYRLSATQEMTVVGHVEQMHHSECYRQSESLTCSTCHDPHSDYSADEQITRYRQACLNCHESKACTEQANKRAAKQDRCTVCHMPAAPTEIPHVPFTHHRIGIHRPEAPESAADSGSQLVNMLTDAHLPAADADRCRGLGWLRFFLLAKGDPQRNLTTARDYLTRAWKAGARDAAVSAGLGTIAKEFGRFKAAQQWAQRTLDLEKQPSDDRVMALECLSKIQYDQGDLQAALRGYTELTKIRRDARHWFMRGMVEYSLKDSAAALASFIRSNAINPRHSGTHTVLAQLYAEHGDTDKSQFHADRAKLLED